MLEKSVYDSWASRIRLFIKGKKHGRMMLDSIDNGPLVYPTVKENGQTRLKKYSELIDAQQLQDDCDVQATNIIFPGLPPDYNLFDKFAHVPGETLYEYYWRFSQLINDMHIIGMTMQQVQVNTKFLNALRSKFVTDVNRERYLDSLAFVANSPTLYNPSQSPQHLGEDLIECINKAIEFLSVVASRFPPSKNQLRTLSNSRNQATIQDGRVTVQQVQGRQNQSYAGEGHMVRQCTQPKRPRNAAWFKEKLMLAEAQEAAFQTDNLDAYESDCNDLSSAKAVLMANLSSCDPDVLSEDTNPSTPNDLLVLSLVEQMIDHIAHLDKENQTNKMVNESLTAELERYRERITIFEQRLNVDLKQREKLIDSQMDALIHDKNAKLAAFQQEIDTLNETLSNNVKEKESLSKILTVFKTKSKKESKYIDKEIVLEKQNKEVENIICKMYQTTQAMHTLTKPQVFYDDTHKQALGYQNPFYLKKAQRIQPTLYDGSVIAKEHAVISVNDDEEIIIDFG
ncbi:hypothetical protein Tco_0000316 [Tanacetum coccineum]